MRRTSSEELIANVEAAVSWAGMPNTRVKPLLQQLCAALATRSRRPTRDTLLIIEASTVADIHFLWRSRAAEYPGLLLKIKNSVSRGPLLTDDEEKGKPHTEARNNRFTYLLAGCLLKGGAPIVSIEGITRQGLGPASPTDIVVDWECRRVPIECKRPFDTKTLQRNVERAAKGISQHSAENGVVAVDCSRLVRSPQTVSFRFGEEHALVAVESQLRDLVMKRMLESASERVAGLLAFARVPTVLFTGWSPVLTSCGDPRPTALPITVDSWMHEKREGVENAQVIDMIASALKWVEG